MLRRMMTRMMQWFSIQIHGKIDNVLVLRIQLQKKEKALFWTKKFIDLPFVAMNSFREIIIFPTIITNLPQIFESIKK